MPKVVHFEIPADDPQRALAFYQKAFGWTFEKWGEWPYWLTQGGPEDEPGVNGGLMPRDDNTRTPVLVIGVESIDDAAKAVVAAGGRELAPKMPIPGVGWSARYADSEGNVIGIYQADAGAE